MWGKERTFLEVWAGNGQEEGEEAQLDGPCPAGGPAEPERSTVQYSSHQSRVASDVKIQ